VHALAQLLACRKQWALVTNVGTISGSSLPMREDAKWYGNL
jgi:hypothetical protein